MDNSPEIERGGNTWFSASAHFRHAHNRLVDERPMVSHVPDREFEKGSSPEVIEIPPPPISKELKKAPILLYQKSLWNRSPYLSTVPS